MIDDDQWLICKKISVGMLSASARENRGAEGGEVWGGGVPLPTGRGVWGGGYAPSPEKFLNFHPKMVRFGARRSDICNVSQPAFTRKLKLQQHTVPYHNTIYAYLSHIQFLIRKTGCIWVLTSSCTVFAPLRDSA